MAFVLAGCHGNASQVQAQPTSDPASANLASASDTTPAAENPPPPPPDASAGTTAPESSASRGAAVPVADSSGYGDQYPSDDQAGYDDEYDVAAEAPPPIPEYDQPDCPGDDYIWTPGYWAYAPEGYYWVPGAWVLAPYIGALWTPGYWEFDRDRYHWHTGYWGPHVGFYGGVNYGFGYEGRGYEGGYWRGRDFYYNRSITRVNTTVVRNVYNYRVTNVFNTTRVSYNGGNGGLRYRPTAAEETARNQRRFAALPVQISRARDAMQNRGQFAKENHGRPQNFVLRQPINEGRSAPAPRAEDFHPASAGRGSAGQRGSRPESTPQAGGRTEPGRGREGQSAPENRGPIAAPRPTPGQGIHPQPGQPEPQYRQEQHSHPGNSNPSSGQPERRQGPQPRMESKPVPNPRGDHSSPRQDQQQRQGPRNEGRPQPEFRQPEPAPGQGQQPGQGRRPERMPQQRPPQGPPPQQQERPQPQPQQRPEQRPQAEQRPEPRPQPGERPDARPQPPHQGGQQGPREQPHPDGRPGEDQHPH